MIKSQTAFNIGASAVLASLLFLQIGAGDSFMSSKIACLDGRARHDKLLNVHHDAITDLQENLHAVEEQHITNMGELVEIVDSLRQTRVREMRVTGYHPKRVHGGATTALTTPIVPGHTVAVSPACRDWLGLEIYIDGIGIRNIEDLTSTSVDKKHPELCTIDVALPLSVPTKQVGNKVRRVVRLN